MATIARKGVCQSPRRLQLYRWWFHRVSTIPGAKWTGLLTSCSEAIEDLTGGVTTEIFTTDILNKNKFWSEEIMKVNEEFLFSCATGTFDKWQGSDLASSYGARENIVRMHAYSIMEAREIKGHRLLKVRNPWGEGEWRGAWSDGSEQWTPEWMELLNHRFGDDGQFWISYEDLLREYSSFDRTRLFGSDWQITQQWTTVDVPWSADYNKTKFSVTLTKRSPVVIVLSQLDSRYYRGLEGQYTFQLHFRLDKDGEDYIVRSHGNYSMSRSVSTDLELDPGTYSVLMKITARRYQDDDTAEDIIRKNVKLRQNKLIQIGLAYDLAHAKGEIREAEAEKQKRQERELKSKAAEKKKQYAMRREDKLKDWQRGKREKAREKRHAKKREEYERKKAEKRRGPEPAEGSVAGDAAAVQTDQATIPKAVDGTKAALGIEAEIEKQAAAGATEDKTGEPAPDPASLPQPPTQAKIDESKPTNGAPLESIAEDSKPTSGSQAEDTSVAPKNGDEEKDAVKSAETSTAQKSQQFEAALRSVPSVTVNGAPAPTSEAPPPSIAPPSTLAPNDDYQYDSDASFDSSIDSVLDFPAAVDVFTEEELSATDGADDNAEFENDPWNAVCVVGLRVFFKDGTCSVETVRPRQDEEPLDLDDASKGASGEVEGDGK